jgi:hypothetical protein
MLCWEQPLARSGALVIAALALIGCAILPSTQLPMNPSWQGNCGRGVGRDAILHGSASDGRVTWATDNNGGDRVELLWPRGYAARFSPQLEVLDVTGQVVAHEGDLILGSCLTAPEDGGAIRIEAGDVRAPTWKPGDG